MTNQDINKIKVHKGEVLYVVYIAIVKTGELSLDAILTRLNNNNKDESVWSNTLKNNRSETINIPINDDGEVIFRIKGTKKSGSYNIKWDVKSKDEAAKK
ncbi:MULTISPECIES: hypothetical protein [unclassified Paenibacillus]|uniref:hypothetical protein n=1 Tax=unclassified Paenibacillus TaxID=185978 RepID=UPI00070C2BDF|nr:MULTISPECIES: hypothetical protein [unclassified Paenibacillus]KQX53935.1 hypothetical protein ASD40_34695 [Paenibacillus sp. Root444D2]KRE37342.1 hypothetical protein ASG85_35720 [Paenibacillus sp. Soil724D2]